MGYFDTLLRVTVSMTSDSRVLWINAIWWQRKKVRAAVVLGKLSTKFGGAAFLWLFEIRCPSVPAELG
jgi:hypothetical protein